MSGYIGTQPVPQATQVRDVFTATSGQTTFATGGYTPNFVDVYLNGVKLVDGDDFTATNGSEVVLTTGATVGDTVEVLAYTAFSPANVYTIAEADALVAAVIAPATSGTTGQVLTSNGTVDPVWADAAAGAAGGGSDKVFWENDQTVTADYTITNGKNAGSFGPITIASGVTVTVGAGESWVII